MLDIGFSELLLCFVVALVVLGPERLPGIARGIGRWTGKAKTYMRNLSAELERESSVAELKAQIGDARRILNEESSALKRSFDQTAAEGRAIVGEAREVVEGGRAVGQPEPGTGVPHDGLHPDVPHEGLHPDVPHEGLYPDVPHEGLRPPERVSVEPARTGAPPVFPDKPA